MALARALPKGPRSCCWMSLVNLDHKLREELREELTQLFAAGQSTVVYATTEPAEALLLRGYTAVLDEGRLLQHGPTADVSMSPARCALRVLSVIRPSTWSKQRPRRRACTCRGGTDAAQAAGGDGPFHLTVGGARQRPSACTRPGDRFRTRYERNWLRFPADTFAACGDAPGRPLPRSRGVLL